VDNRSPETLVARISLPKREKNDYKQSNQEKTQCKRTIILKYGQISIVQTIY